MAQLRAWSEAIRTILDTGMDGLEHEQEGPAHNFTNYFEAKLKRLPAGSKRIGLFEVTELSDHARLRETAANLMFIAFSGHETTVHLLATLVLHLAQDPDLWDSVRGRPDRAGNLVSEILRLESPVQKLCRWAMRDVEFANGHRLYEGENAVLLVGAANRDPLRFPAPDRVDLGRAPASHLAFGKGAHSCIGRALATMEGEAVLRWLIRNVRRLELQGGGFSWITNSTFRGLSRLSLTLRS
jgi:cytochrome P450